jgi:uncharacterized membrane protein ArfC
MDYPHWELIALAFVLGLVLTFALMIRRVKLEVPVSKSTGAAAAGGVASFAGGRSRAESEPPTAKIATAEEEPTTKISTTEEPPTTKMSAGAAAAAARGAAGSKAADSESETKKIPAVTYAPYGVGSARAGADGSGPSGWLVKGNEDSKLYHTPDSPSYEQTVAEVWFRDEESAVRAGFAPWQKGTK